MVLLAIEERPRSINHLYPFYELSIDMLGVAGFDGFFLELSQSWERVLGYSRDELLSTPYIEFVHPEDQASTLEKAAGLTHGQAALCFENRYRTSDGSYRWIEWNATPYPEEQFIYFVARDVTERKRMEQAQREAEEKLRAATERLRAQAVELEEQASLLRLIQSNIPLCVWRIDRQGFFTHHAGKGLRAAGLQDGAFLGKNTFELYPSPENATPVRRALDGELSHSFSEGHNVFWENWHIPVRNERHEVTAVAGISLDISEARRASDALQAKLELIERQKQIISSLSTPIIQVWDKVLTLPMVGVLDSTRAAEVMENLLSRIAQTRARFAILDLTGIEAVDTGTAAHLLKLIHAIRLLGAEGVITGIHPGVAQTMVSLGVELGRIVTLASLRDGLEHCMRMMGEAVGRGGARGAPLHDMRAPEPSARRDALRMK